MLTWALAKQSVEQNREARKRFTCLEKADS